MRIAVLFDRLGPYHHARLAALARRCDLLALEIRETDDIYEWDKVGQAPPFARRTLLSGGADAQEELGRTLRGLESSLVEFKPEALAIPGYNEPWALGALRLARKRGIPTVLMSDSQRMDFPRHSLLEAVKRGVVRGFDAGLCSGSQSGRYLAELGLKPESVFGSYDVVDNRHFSEGAARAREGAAAKREALGLPGRYFFSAFRFIEKKNPFLLLRAYARYSRLASDPWGLVMAGNGPLGAEIKAQAGALGLGRLARFPGFLQYHELPAYYGLASAFVLPSLSEQWGLVANEAMAAGLPVLVSNRCGCAPDLVQEGLNGFSFDPHDEAALAGLMLKVSAEGFPLDAMGKAGSARIQGWSPESFAENMLAACGHAAARPKPGFAPHLGLLLWLLAYRPRFAYRREDQGGLKAAGAGAVPGKPRVAVLFDRLGPYHVARLKAFSQLAELLVLEMRGMDEVYLWDKVPGSGEFRRHTLLEGGTLDRQRLELLEGKIRAEVQAFAPDVLAIPGWSEPWALSTLALALEKRIRTVIMSASPEADQERRRAVERVKGMVVRLFDAGLGGGTPQKDYLVALGLPAEAAFQGYDAVDNAHFSQGAEMARMQGPALRAALGLPERYFFVSARFVPKKNLEALLEAYAAYRAQAQEPWGLVMAGDGPLAGALRKKISGLGLEGQVRLPGFIQYAALPSYYGLASAFVLPSLSEQWGLAVNEAMAAGLPLLLSRRCGCAVDLLEEGKNGFSFDPLDRRAMAAAMLRLSEEGPGLQAMGAHSRHLVEGWSPERFAQNLGLACAHALARPSASRPALARAFLWLLSRRPKFAPKGEL